MGEKRLGVKDRFPKQVRRLAMAHENVPSGMADFGRESLSLIAYHAWTRGYTYVVQLDGRYDFTEEIWASLFPNMDSKAVSGLGEFNSPTQWVNPLAIGGIPVYARGLHPDVRTMSNFHTYITASEKRQAAYDNPAVQVGLCSDWLDIENYDAFQYERSKEPVYRVPFSLPGFVRVGQNIPWSSRFMCYRVDVAPLMYCWPRREHGLPLTQWGDVFMGCVAKRIMDHLGLGLIAGHPVVLLADRRGEHSFPHCVYEHAIFPYVMSWLNESISVMHGTSPLQCMEYVSLSLRMALSGLDVPETWSSYMRDVVSGMDAWVDAFKGNADG